MSRPSQDIATTSDQLFASRPDRRTNPQSPAMYSPSPSMEAHPSNGTFVQTSPDYGQGPPRKKMRKGTKSCLECRRRKIKCTFEAGRPAVCNECYARGSTCVDQEHGEVNVQGAPPGEQSYSLRERVTQLEGLVREVLNRLPEGSTQREPSTPTLAPGPAHGETHAAAEALKNLKTSVSAPMMESGLALPGGRHEDAPALSLFDNAVISRRTETPSISVHQHNKSRRLLQELHKLIPTPRDLEIILDAAAQWWNLWSQMFPIIKDPRCGSFKESVSHSLRSDKPAEVAKMILCIAISMDQLPVDFEKNLSHLTSARDLMEHCVNVVDQLITSDDEIGATVEGIECMVLEAKFHINLGRPRRAYVLYRRAISFAQLIGLHRIGNHPSTDDPFIQRQQSLWTHVFQGDRYLSLILGLPYGVPERFCVVQVPNSIEMRGGERYLMKVMPLIGKIVDRNQDPAHMSLSTTLRIDAELEEISHSMPPSFWETRRDQHSPGSSEAFYDRLIAQFFHHQLRTYIHLPYMLNGSDKRYHYSHESAVNSSREMVKIYSTFRDDSEVGPYVCKLIDFQAFTAAMLLLLNLFGYSQNARAQKGAVDDPKQSHEQDVRDWAMIDETIAGLKKASKEAGGIVAAQSAKALELLASARDKECDKESTCEIAIPMFGVLRIGAGSGFRVPQAPVKQPPNISNISAVNGCTPQLPTPPASTATNHTSSVHSSSTQPSPVMTISPSFTTGGSHTAVPSAPNVSSQNKIISGNDDHFISFDNLMGLPQTDFFPFQPTTPLAGQIYGGAVTGTSNGGLDNMGTTGLGGPSSWTFPTFGSGIMDLDQGWNWSGDGTLAGDWGTGSMNNNAFSEL